MVQGYVMFADTAAYEVVHLQARTALGLPRTGRRGGILAPDRQKTTGVAPFRTNLVDLDDRKVVVFIQSEFWPSDLVRDFTFLTQNDVVDYFPPDIQ